MIEARLYGKRELGSAEFVLDKDDVWPMDGVHPE
jgi:hypothetical protein